MLELPSRIPQILTSAQAYEPEQFLRSNEILSAQTLSALKSLYDYTKTQEAKEKTSPQSHQHQQLRKTSKKKRKQSKVSNTENPLAELITESFDSDQIWEEVQLQNALIYENLVTSISQLLAASRIAEQRRPELHLKNEEEEDNQFSEEGGSNFEDEEEGDDDLNEQEDDEEEEDAELELDIPKKSTVEEPDEEEIQIPETGLSNFEKRRKKIEENIKLMEDDALEPKSWKYQGEVTAEKRPENSLLEEHLLFDHLLKQG